MKKTLTIVGLLLIIGASWCIYRDYKYPIFKESRIMNKVIIPQWLFNPTIASKLNSLSEKEEFPPLIDGVERENKKFKSRDGKDLLLTEYSPTKSKNKKLPSIVYIHGGGFLLKDFSGQHQMVAEYAKRVKARVYFVNYRTADRDPFPIPFYDCVDSLKYVWENKEKLNVDEEKIALAGDSAGGALAASTQLWARNESDINISFLSLIYPVTDNRLQTESMKEFTDSPIWNSRLSKKMWNLYLRNGNKYGEKDEYISPARAKTFNNLSNAYIEVAEYDALRDEGLAYANSLKKAGKEVTINYVKNGFHAYDTDLYNNIHTKKNLEKRIAAFRSAFS